MLEIRNLTKVYRSKTGEAVRALDNVSISFPDSGMVFILGKSGSGKSTLLNVMGGLDSYDSGEFIIKGKSSKNFAGSDFDAYRNTFIGFIFQEYNVLDDFTVGANIGLALELQGRKATDDKINRILAQVDLLSYAKRKPNELSGGQKQRVAIARALVKEPQIIMADEPTGALDSNTGKQIFDTLKELSKEKLVLIVSHDRDFAERYADRIVELSDGRIISDVTKHAHESVQVSEGIQQITGNILRIKGGYRLTERDLQMINNYLAANEGDVMLSGDGRINEELRSAAGIGADGSTSVFADTTGEDYAIKPYPPSDAKFIHSRLPMKNAVKIGSSGLKYKKFRLAMTIILSMIAFALFGFADSLGAYDKIDSAVQSIKDSNIKTAAFSLSSRTDVTYEDGETYSHYQNAMFNEDDVQFLKNHTGIDFIPVFAGPEPYNPGFNLATQFQLYEQNEVYNGKLAGLINADLSTLNQAGLTVSGSLPNADGEIAITELAVRQFNQYGFKNASFNETLNAGSVTSHSILGKHLTIATYNGTFDYVIVGVVDTAFDCDRYNSLLPSDRDISDEGNALAEMVLITELKSELAYGFHMMGFMTENDIKTVAQSAFQYNISQYLGSVEDKSMALHIVWPEKTDSVGVRSFYEIAPSSALSRLSVTWLDGTPRQTLGANEVLIPQSLINDMIPYEITYTVDSAELAAEVAKYYGAEAWNETDPAQTYEDRIRRAAVIAYIDEQVSNDTVLEAVTRHRMEMNGEYMDPIPADRLLTAEEAKQYWIEAWFYQGMDSAPVSFSPSLGVTPTLQGYYQTMEAALVPLYPYLAEFIGIEIPDAMFSSPEQINSIYVIRYFFGNTSDENPSYTVSRHELQSNMIHAYAHTEVKEKELWKDSDFINTVILADKSNDTAWESITEEQDKLFFAVSAYENYLSNPDRGFEENAFGNRSGLYFRDKTEQILREKTAFDLNEVVSSLSFSLMMENTMLGTNEVYKDYNFQIVGLYDDTKVHQQFIVSDTVLNDHNTWYESTFSKDFGMTETRYPHEDGSWSFVIAPMGDSEEVIRKMVELSYDQESGLKFSLQNAVMNTLNNFNDFIEIGAQVFLYIGIGFAAFSALLLMNFISTSISYKKREIGVLRAVGARSSDVFKIFFSESAIIALINFVLSMAIAIGAVIFTNNYMRGQGINVTLLSFGIRQVALMLLVTLAVAAIASFLPVYSIAKRKPIDAIKDR